MEANLFRVKVTVNGNLIISPGFPVYRGYGGWTVYLGECIGCGEDAFLDVSTTSQPDVIVDDASPNRGDIFLATVSNHGHPKLRRPDDSVPTISAIVMLGHFDELSSEEPGVGVYHIGTHGSGVFQVYRNQKLRFRCPDGKKTYSITFDGKTIQCASTNPAEPIKVVMTQPEAALA